MNSHEFLAWLGKYVQVIQYLIHGSMFNFGSENEIPTLTLERVKQGSYNFVCRLTIDQLSKR